MIKLKGMHIHFLTIVLFGICAYLGRIEEFVSIYAIMTVHELSHFVAAKGIGLKCREIIFYPFGVNLRLRNKMLPTVAEDMILYLSGPLSNIVMALVSKFFFCNFPGWQTFYYRNIILFMLNMLPITPLDGGNLLRSVLSRLFGAKRSVKITKFISCVIVLIFWVLIYMERKRVMNFSFIFFTIFLLGNVFCENEKYDTELLRVLMFADRNLKCRKAHIVVAKDNDTPHDIVKEFTNNRYNIVFLIGENGEIEKIVSEKKVLDALLEN